jgi:hypothetical protein
MKHLNQSSHVRLNVCGTDSGYAIPIKQQTIKTFTKITSIIMSLFDHLNIYPNDLYFKGGAVLHALFETGLNDFDISSSTLHASGGFSTCRSTIVLFIIGLLQVGSLHFLF